MALVFMLFNMAAFLLVMAVKAAAVGFGLAAGVLSAMRVADRLAK